MDKKDQILQIAVKIFTRFGFKKTTMDEIARFARMGKSTLYYYYKSKEEIWAAVIQKEAVILKQKITAALQPAMSPQQKLSTYFLTRMLFLKELTNYYRFLTEDYFEYFSFVEQEREEFTNFETETLIQILQQGVNEQVFEIADVHTTARMLILAAKGLEYPILGPQATIDVEAEIQLMLNILFKGIETRS